MPAWSMDGASRNQFIAMRRLTVVQELLGGGRVYIDEDHGLVSEDFAAVGHVARGIPYVSGADFLDFIPDGEAHPAAEHEAELFALMGVESVGGAGLELGANKLHVPAVNDFFDQPGVLEGPGSTSVQLNILPRPTIAFL